jgi:serine O-acetyltransferase
MNQSDFTHILTQAVDELSSVNEADYCLFRPLNDGEPLPSAIVLQKVVELFRAIIFPGYYGEPTVDNRIPRHHIGVNTQKLFDLLTEQIWAGMSLDNTERLEQHPETRRQRAAETAIEFIRRLPRLRNILTTDVEAAYNGDPAAENYGEVICCYPAIKAISNYRMAHELLTLGVPLIPRIITEMAHSETGIDIHPGATIGHHFTIDHGTGVVIGATCIIGNNVKLYQGVTLGAKSFPLDDDGNPIKGIPRHPIIEDDVTIYSNATVLGRITIGRGATIGGNIWVTESLEPGARIVQKK